MVIYATETCQCGHRYENHRSETSTDCWYCPDCPVFRSCRLLAAPTTLEEKLDRALLLVSSVDDECVIGIVRRPHGVFAIGDVVAAYITHGQADRWKTFGYSSKKHANIRGYYVVWSRWASLSDMGYQKWRNMPDIWRAASATAAKLRYEKRHAVAYDVGSPRYHGVVQMIESRDDKLCGVSDPVFRAYALEALQRGSAASG